MANAAVGLLGKTGLDNSVGTASYLGKNLEANIKFLKEMNRVTKPLTVTVNSKAMKSAATGK